MHSDKSRFGSFHLLVLFASNIFLLQNVYISFRLPSFKHLLAGTSGLLSIIVICASTQTKVEVGCFLAYAWILLGIALGDFIRLWLTVLRNVTIERDVKDYTNIYSTSELSGDEAWFVMPFNHSEPSQILSRIMSSVTLSSIPAQFLLASFLLMLSARIAKLLSQNKCNRIQSSNCFLWICQVMYRFLSYVWLAIGSSVLYYLYQNDSISSLQIFHDTYYTIKPLIWDRYDSLLITALSSSVLTAIFIVSSDIFNEDNRILAWNTIVLSLSFLSNVFLLLASYFFSESLLYREKDFSLCIPFILTSIWFLALILLNPFFILAQKETNIVVTPIDSLTYAKQQSENTTRCSESTKTYTTVPQISSNYPTTASFSCNSLSLPPVVLSQQPRYIAPTSEARNVYIV